ncbi:MAG: hypothetical protein PHI06_00265 [Desulfobulbaceae bacterium]|nr:hypothetical protein [Desulfobulbaceae bacterium]
METLSRQIWPADAKEISDLIHALIDGQFLVTLHRQGAHSLRSRILAIHTHRHVPYLLLSRPTELDNVYQISDLLFKLSGLPILGFSCPVTRDSELILATMLPTTLFSVELRHDPRLSALPGAMATFFVPGRSQVNVCQLQNISGGGVKLLGRLAHSLGKNDMIGPCTLSLSRKGAAFRREVTINAAEVIRVVQQGKDQGLGLKFALTESEEQQLQEQLAFLRQRK